jgi:hypothetical protein
LKKKIVVAKQVAALDVRLMDAKKGLVAEGATR